MAVGRAEDANRRWSRMLADWSIPDQLIASAPESPYFFDLEVFTAIADDAFARSGDTPSDAVAREALPPRGSVLDVGVGAGAASLRLDAGHVVGVDPSGELLAAFAERAAKRRQAVTLLEGTWPDIASQAPVVDVAVCHHVVYNVSDLAAFAEALSSHARSRVVVEATTVHPMTWMAPYWNALHGLSQPNHPRIERRDQSARSSRASSTSSAMATPLSDDRRDGPRPTCTCRAALVSTAKPTRRTSRGPCHHAAAR